MCILSMRKLATTSNQAYMSMSKEKDSKLRIANIDQLALLQEWYIDQINGIHATNNAIACFTISASLLGLR